MANSWTEEQALAINKDNTNIIVSAGAGSGKTMVLKERVLRKLRSGISINQLLILTFTKKAAFEMKDRIRKGIEKDESLKKELDYIDSSYITTFDSFALSIVKKYSYLLNIGSDVTIADESTIYLEKQRIIDDIFDRLYEERNEKFLKIINDFTVKKDNNIKEAIISINNALDLKYDKISYLDNYLNNHFNDEYYKALVNDYNELLLSKIKELNDLLTDFSHNVDIDYFNDVLTACEPLLNSSNYNEIKSNITFKFPQLPRGSEEDVKNAKKTITDFIDKFEDFVRFDSIDEMLNYYISTKDYISVIIDIIKELDERLNSFKTNLNVFEFTDISKMAIRIVEQNQVVREELTNSFNEIMIDEYQDTSDLQEDFIKLIANNNVYMVGDIKQSIYRFRNANPYLFKEKYDSYSNNIDGFKIDLTKNFRSRNEVIENINLIFSAIMTDNMGGADYVTSHKMEAKNGCYLTTGKTDYNNNFELVNYEYNKECGFTQSEIEIFYIVKDIRDKVEHKYQIYDKELEILRDVNYGDFAILLEKSTQFDLYKKIFQYFNIPMTKYNFINITDEVEINLFNNIIKILINRRDNNYDVEFNYALTSILRSYLFNYDDETIFDVITNKNYDIEAIKIIDSIVDNINSLSLKEIIYLIIDKFDFYTKIITVGDIKNRINRINSIVDIFDGLASIGYTIDDAYNYLTKIIEDQYELKTKELDVIPNSVKIMTIHASKGLEFPICYFASLNTQFNVMDLNERFMFYNKYGIICPYFKEGIGKTFVKDLVRNDYLLEEVSEKIRLFYVALTRAREKFIIVTSLPEKKTVSIKNSKSFLDFINYIKDDLSTYIKNIDISSLNLTSDYNLIKKTNYQDCITKSNEMIDFKEINIHNTELHKEKISKETHDLLDKSTKEKMKFGTYIHEILELIDFKNPNLDNINIDNYYKDKINNFISQIEVDRLINYYKEYEFVYKKEDNVLHGIVDLILEYDDHIKIIDYKLKNVSDENYIKQLENYRDYISLKTNKKIDIYLFSIIDGTFNKLS